MKYFGQFIIILAVSFIWEVLSYLIPLPVPASIYGIVIMFLGLLTGLIPLRAVKETGLFLVEIMPVMFIPAAVGLIESWGVIKQSWVSYLFIMVATTAGVMVVAGRVTQLLIRKGNRHE